MRDQGLCSLSVSVSGWRLCEGKIRRGKGRGRAGGVWIERSVLRTFSWVDDDGAFLDEVTSVVGGVRRYGVRSRFGA